MGTSTRTIRLALACAAAAVSLAACQPLDQGVADGVAGPGPSTPTTAPAVGPVPTTLLPGPGAPPTTAPATTAPAGGPSTTTAPPTTRPPTTAPVPTAPPPTRPPTTTAPPAPGGAGAGAGFTQAGELPELAGCQLYPRNHYMNATGVDRLAVHPRSAAWLAPLDDGSPTFHPRAKLSVDGSRNGMPFNVVDSRVVGTKPVLLNLSYSDRGYQGRYPMPARPVVQGSPGWHADRHVLVLDVADCNGYELIGFEPLSMQVFGVWTALNGTRYPLDTVAMPVTTTNSPNTPMFGQYVRRDEVARGRVNHVLAVCSNLIGSSKVWPARSSDGKQAADAIPMGAWLRLKAGVDRSRFTGDARPVVDALAVHGAVLTDTCGHRLGLQGESSATWNDADMSQLAGLGAGDFEVVDVSPMVVDPTTYAIR